MANFSTTGTGRGLERLDHNLFVTGAAEFDGAVQMDGAVTMTSTLAVTGASTFQGLAMTGSPVQIQRATFNVSAGGAAGTHTATINIPAGSVLLDIVVHGVALWNAGTSATMIVGDGDDPDGYFAAVDMKATDLLAGESINLVAHGGKAGAYVVGTLPTGHWEFKYTAATRTVAGVITLVGTAATTGETVMEVYYSKPASGHTTAATFVAT